MLEQMNMFPDDAQMSGGGYEGADQLSRKVGLWYPQKGSGDQQVLPQMDESAARHNDILRNDAYAMGAMEKHQDNIVGPEFRLKAIPKWRLLGPMFDEMWLKEFRTEVETKFSVWAEDPECFVDASGMTTFTGLIRQMVGPMFLAYGEVLATAEYIRSSSRVLNTAIQLIDPARLSNPDAVPETTFFRGGVEKDRWGRPQRYHIRNTHPYDYATEWRDLRWTSVPAYKPWGRKQVIHIVEQHRVGQTRGIGKFVSALKELRMGRTLNDMELMNVTLNALYAAMIETDLPADMAAVMMDSYVPGQDNQELDNPVYRGMMSNIQQYFGGKNLYMDGAKIPILPPGTKLNMQRATTDANKEHSFQKSLMTYAARAFGMSYEEFSSNFTDSNFSSARAALGETWKYYQSKKRGVAGRAGTDIYALWLEEMISKGQIESLPAGSDVVWFNEGFNKAALTKSRWLGAPRTVIDPEKENKGIRIALSMGRTTLEKVCGEDGEDWQEMLEQKAREKEYAESLGLELNYDDNSTTGASTAEATDDDDEMGEEGNERDADAGA